MSEIELEILIETMINRYGTALVKIDRETGNWTLLEPKDVLMLRRSLISDYQFERTLFSDFCLQGKRLEQELIKKRVD